MGGILEAETPAEVIQVVATQAEAIQAVETQEKVHQKKISVAVLTKNLVLKMVRKEHEPVTVKAQEIAALLPENHVLLTVVNVKFRMRKSQKKHHLQPKTDVTNPVMTTNTV